MSNEKIKPEKEPNLAKTVTTGIQEVKDEIITPLKSRIDGISFWLGIIGTMATKCGGNELSRSINQLLKGCDTGKEVLQQIEGQVLGPILSTLEPFLGDSDERKRMSKNLLAQGWYLNQFLIPLLGQDNDELEDGAIIEHLKTNISSTKNYLLKQSPERKEIIEEALELHEKGFYHGSIVLFLTLADGISSDKNPKFSMFSKSNQYKESIGTQDDVNACYQYLWEQVHKKDQQISKNSSKAAKDTGKGVNRHGVIHGSSEHLEYGTEVNSYKTLTFLLFVAEVIQRKE